MGQRSDEEIEQAYKVFEELWKQFYQYAEEESDATAKAEWQKESICYTKLAELCNWFLGRKSIFDAMLKEKKPS